MKLKFFHQEILCGKKVPLCRLQLSEILCRKGDIYSILFFRILITSFIINCNRQLQMFFAYLFFAKRRKSYKFHANIELKEMSNYAQQMFENQLFSWKEWALMWLRVEGYIYASACCMHM